MAQALPPKTAVAEKRPTEGFISIPRSSTSCAVKQGLSRARARTRAMLTNSDNNLYRFEVSSLL